MARDTDGTSTTSKKSDAWRFFHDSGRKYRTDKTHHEARCLGCLKKIDSALKKYDADQVSRGLLPRTEARTSSQLRNQAVRDLDPICGKIDALKRHITKCDDAGDAAKTWCAGEKVKEVTLKLAQETAEGNEGGVSQLPGKQKKQSVFGIVQAKSFTKKEQIEYEHNVLKLTVALNAAWRGVDIPFVRWFFDKYVPSGHLPHRQQLSSHILNEEVDTITEDIKTEVHGLYGTGSVDGWSTKKDAVQTTGLNVFGKEYPLNMHVTTPERKTSANLLQHVLKDIEIMTVTWGIVLVAWACDSGGDSKGLRRLLLEIMPWIIAIPCWAHQMNLIAGDYLIKSDSRVIDVLEQCLLVINWFLGHKRAHSMLENEQDREEWARHLTFIRAGITRWTTHYLSMRRLLELKKVLRSLVLRDEDILLTAGGDKEEQVEAAQAIIDIIEDRDFWAGVARTKIYLEPLAYATNVAQGASTRLDHVLVTLATLHRTYSVESDVFDDPVASAALLKSLQKRWAALKTDQDVYLVAVFLNPYFRAFFFNDSDDAPHSLSRIGFYGLVKRVYKRVFRLEAGDDVPPELFSNYLQYYDGEGRFTKDKLGLDEFKQEYKGQDTVQFMNTVWKGLPKSNPLARLALLVLSIVANSAGIERHYSKLGHIYQDKHRSLLDPKRAHKTAMVSRSIRLQFPEKPHAKRSFIRVDHDVSAVSLDADIHIDAETDANMDADVDMDEEREDDDSDDARGAQGLLRSHRRLAADDNDGSGSDESDDDNNPPVPAVPRVTLHFGLNERIALKDIFHFDEQRRESPWGGTMWMFQVVGERTVEEELRFYDNTEANDETGAEDAPMVVD